MQGGSGRGISLRLHPPIHANRKWEGISLRLHPPIHANRKWEEHLTEAPPTYTCKEEVGRASLLPPIHAKRKWEWHPTEAPPTCTCCFALKCCTTLQLLRSQTLRDLSSLAWSTAISPSTQHSSVTWAQHQAHRHSLTQSQPHTVTAIQR